MCSHINDSVQILSAEFQWKVFGSLTAAQSHPKTKIMWNKFFCPVLQNVLNSAGFLSSQVLTASRSDKSSVKVKITAVGCKTYAPRTYTVRTILQAFSIKLCGSMWK